VTALVYLKRHKSNSQIKTADRDHTKTNLTVSEEITKSIQHQGIQWISVTG